MTRFEILKTQQNSLKCWFDIYEYKLYCLQNREMVKFYTELLKEEEEEDKI